MIDLDAIRKIFNVFSHVCEVYMAVSNIGAKRRWWVRPVNLSRDNLGLHATCIEQLQRHDPDHFFKSLRMDNSRFNLLLTLLEGRLSRNSIRRPIPPAMRLAVTLVYLAQGCNFHILAVAFKMGESTVRNIVYDTCEAIWEELLPIYMTIPNIVDWKHTSDKFYTQTGLPHCLGAIDGKLVAIKCPRQSGSLYFSYKKRFSIILLAACDADYSFTMVDVGAVGSQSDSGVFTRSVFGKLILENKLPVPAEESLPGSDIVFPYYFVADAAFPLRNNIMRPYPRRLLPADKSNFNKTLSKARVRIEIAFGILANRWSVLQTTITASPKNVDKIILATVALHNFLILHKDSTYFTERDLQLSENTNVLSAFEMSHGNRSSQRAFHLRDTLKDFLM